MQIAQVLAGYTLGGADLLRRAMGKKKPEEMAKQREIFTEGAVKNGVAQDTATYIFDLMEKFAGYGFNKSHSAAYALLSYQTAWLKAHYPAEFMASVLSADMDNTDKVVRLIDECNDLKLKVIPPDVNLSGYAFSVDQGGNIVYGLGAIKGLGESAIESIERERREHGAFEDLFDFCRRVDTHKLNKRAQEALIRAGALDSLKHNRATLMANLPAAMKLAEQDQHNRSVGQTDIFGAALAAEPLVEVEVVHKPEWDEDQRLAGEKETLGLYLTGHPINRYRDELLQITGKRIADHIDTLESKKTGAPTPGRYANEIDVVLAGLVIGLRAKNTRNGKMAFLVLDDRSARVDILIRPDDYQRFAPLLVRDKVLVIEGGLGPDDFSGGYRLRAKEIFDIDQARQKYSKRLEIGVNASKGANGFLDKLGEILHPHSGGPCSVWIRYQGSSASTYLRLGEQWRVNPSEQLLQRLQALVGPDAVRIVYQ